MNYISFTFSEEGRSLIYIYIFYRKWFGFGLDNYQGDYSMLVSGNTGVSRVIGLQVSSGQIFLCITLATMCLRLYHTKEIRPGEKNFGSGQLIFENWSGGPADIFFNHNLNFPILINANMQTWMPMQRWQHGGVRCWMSVAEQTHGGPGMEKAGCWRVEGPHKSLKEPFLN